MYALSFYGVSGALFYFGLVEIMGRYGLAGLFGLIAYTVVFIFAPLFLEPLRWISRSQAFSSIPNLLVYRFRDWAASPPWCWRCRACRSPRPS